MENRKIARVYQISDILQWSSSNTKGLVISPKYQRGKVWNDKAKSYLMDSIIRGFPIPPIFIRQIVDSTTKQTYREIIDGQQRIRAILEYLSDEYAISKSHNKDFGGQLFSQLDEEVKDKILEYEIFVQIVSEKDESNIYDMFARLNSNNIPLNRQELRNAKYWGEIKIFIYEYSVNTRKLFIKYKTFEEKQIARMADIEFLSWIVIMLMEGTVTDTQTSVDAFYNKYNEDFDCAEIIQDKLDFLFEIINDIFENLGNTIYCFKRKTYMYTLLSFLNHQVYGMEYLEEIGLKRYDIYKKENLDNNKKQLYLKIANFEETFYQIIEEDDKINGLYSEFKDFENLHKSRTTTKKERIHRVSLLNKFMGD
jgi:hypothetical protein